MRFWGPAQLGGGRLSTCLQVFFLLASPLPSQSLRDIEGVLGSQDVGLADQEVVRLWVMFFTTCA